MAEQKQRQKAAPARTEEVVDDAPAKTERGENLKAELDDLLDEIDDVLEENGVVVLPDRQRGRRFGPRDTRTVVPASPMLASKPALASAART